MAGPPCSWGRASPGERKREEALGCWCGGLWGHFSSLLRAAQELVVWLGTFFLALWGLLWADSRTVFSGLRSSLGALWDGCSRDLSCGPCVSQSGARRVPSGAGIYHLVADDHRPICVDICWKNGRTLRSVSW